MKEVPFSIKGKQKGYLFFKIGILMEWVTVPARFCTSPSRSIDYGDLSPRTFPGPGIVERAYDLLALGAGIHEMTVLLDGKTRYRFQNRED